MSDAPTVIPVEQDTIAFDGFPVVGVRLPDGRIGASLRDMCAAMKIDRPSQVQRIRGDETIADCLVTVQIQTRGGMQTADVLTAWAIPYWLTGVELARIKDERKRQVIALFKRHAADILYQHFSQRPALPEGPPEVVPMQQPAPPAQEAGALVWAEYHRQMAAWYEWKEATETRIGVLEDWQGTVEARLEVHEEVLGLMSEMVERLGPATLTPAHQSQVQQYVKRLHEVTGKAYPTIYEDLKLAFSVPRYQEIPEADWDHLVRWFQVQMDRSRRR